MTLPMVILSIVAFVLVVQYYGAPYKPVSDLKTVLLRWGVVIGTVMGFYGGILILVRHARVLVKAERTRGTYRSSIVIASFISFVAVALAYPGNVSSAQFNSLRTFTQAAIAIGLNAMGGLYQYFVAYRTLRVRNIYSALIVISFVLVALWNTPHAVLIFPGLVVIGQWLGNVPHTAASMGATICAAIAATIMGIRALVGREPGLIELEVTEK